MINPAARWEEEKQTDVTRQRQAARIKFRFRAVCVNIFSEKSDFSRVVLTYPISKSKFLKSTKFATGWFLLAAAHIVLPRGMYRAL